MCREKKREPAWVAAIRLALLRGSVEVEHVVDEANLPESRERTVEHVLRTMERRGLLRRAPDHDATGRYLPGAVLVDAGPTSAADVSDGGVHRWGDSP